MVILFDFIRYTYFAIAAFWDIAGITKSFLLFLHSLPFSLLFRYINVCWLWLLVLQHNRWKKLETCIGLCCQILHWRSLALLSNHSYGYLSLFFKLPSLLLFSVFSYSSIEMDLFFPILRRASIAYNDASYENLIPLIPGVDYTGDLTNLLFPRIYF